MSKSPTLLEEKVKINFTGIEDKSKWKKFIVKGSSNMLQVYDIFDSIQNHPFEYINLHEYILTEDKSNNTITLTEMEGSNCIKFRVKVKIFNSFLNTLTQFKKNKNRGDGIKGSIENGEELFDIKSFLSQPLPTKILQLPLNNADPTSTVNASIKEADKSQDKKENKSRSEKGGGSFKMKSKKVIIFGGNLDTIFEANDNCFPTVFYNIITRIEEIGLLVPGLYRESGSSSEIAQLKTIINEGKKLDLNNPPFTDVHVLTGTLKCFFRELETKLIPKYVLDEYLASNEENKWANLEKSLSLLPEFRRIVLKILLTHLSRVKEHNSSNLMDTYNLSVVFGPTLVDSTSFDISNFNSLVRTILDHSQSLLKTDFFVDLNLRKPLSNNENITTSNNKTLPRQYNSISGELEKTNIIPITKEKSQTSKSLKINTPSPSINSKKLPKAVDVNRNFLEELKSSALLKKALSIIENGESSVNTTPSSTPIEESSGNNLNRKKAFRPILNSNDSIDCLKSSENKMNIGLTPKRNTKSVTTSSPGLIYPSPNSIRMDDLISEISSRMKKP